MKLLKLSKKILMPFKNMVKDYKNHEEWNYYYKYEDGILDFEKYIKRLEEIENNIDLGEGVLPFSQYFLVDNDLTEIRGIIRIRHKVDSIHGNIGYNVPPTMRFKNYGKELLKLGIRKAKSDLNIAEFYVSCDIDNIASEKIILANSGIFLETVFDEEVEEYIKRYLIKNIKTTT